MPSRAVISLALLKVNWDLHRKDYLENFVPIIAECIRRSSDEVVSLPTLQKDVREHFGLFLPQSALRTILGRARKRGLVVAENRAYRPNREALGRLDFSAVQRSVMEGHEALVTSLSSFCEERYKVVLAGDDAEDALQSYLEENQLAVLGSTSRGSLIPEARQAGAGRKFLVASFVDHLQRTESPAFTHLETIVKGMMLANALFLPDPSQAERKFRNTEVYFDTGFLIFALGHAGEPRKAPCEELLRLLYETGADLRCFDHTVDEVRGALKACAARLEQGQLKDAYGPSMEYFVEKGCTASDVELFAARISRDLQSLRIRVVDKPEYKKEYQIDEKELEAWIDSQVHYHNPKACIRDVDSVSAVMRLRRLHDFYIIEECRALFVTTNAYFARASREYFCHGPSEGAVSPVVTDHSLTNLIWLKKPLLAPDLPRKRIIADCYAAIQPSEQLWRRYMAEIERLEAGGRVSADDFYLLRHSLEARSALMDATLGEDTAFTQGTVQEILEVVRLRVQGEALAKLEGEAARRREAEETLRRVESRTKDQLGGIRDRAITYARVITHFSELVLFSLLSYGAASTYPWKEVPPSTAWGRYLLAALQMLLLVGSLANLFWGVTIRSALRRIEVALSAQIERRLLRLVGL